MAHLDGRERNRKRNPYLTDHLIRCLEMPQPMDKKPLSERQEKFLRHLNLAENAHQAGNLDRALEEYRLAVRLVPEDVGARNQIGVIFYQMGKLTEACKYMETLIETGPINNCTYNNLGVVYTELFQYERAFWAFQKAKTMKHDTSVLINLARMFSSKKEGKEAAKAYQEAGNINPSDPRAHYMHGIDCGFRSTMPVDEAFKVGEIIKVTKRSPLLTRLTNESAVYATRIEEMDDKRIVILAPTTGATPIPYRAGEEFVMVKEGDNCLFGMAGIIIERIRGDQNFLIISKPATALRIQRRNFVRIPPWKDCTITIRHIITEKKEKIPPLETPPTLRNISAGGMLIEDGGHLPNKAVVHLTLSYQSENKTISMDLEAMGLRRDENLIGMIFKNINKKDQETLSRRIHKEQLYMRRMGKI